MLRRTTFWRWAAAVAALVLGSSAVLAGQGAIRLLEAPGRGSEALALWRTCARQPPRIDRLLLKPCSDVRGRVVWVRRSRRANQPDEIHFALLARFHLFIVKSERAPSVGSSVRVVGPLVRASNGMREVQAWVVREA